MFLGVLVALSAGLAPVSDVQIGDDGQTARVVIVCGGPCTAEPMDSQSFFLAGVSAHFKIDVRSRSDLLETVSLRRATGGSALSVKTSAPSPSVRAGLCGRFTYCFDFKVPAAPQPTQEASAPRVSARTASATRPSLEMLSADLERLMMKTGLMTAQSPQALEVATRDDQACGRAEAALVADAWNLFAYRAVAICLAKAGEETLAMAYTSRLNRFAGRIGASRSAILPLTALR